MQEMLFECGLTYSKTFSERNGRQDISGHSDKCMENIQERVRTWDGVKREIRREA